MSWFSREWDGVHLEGCPQAEAECCDDHLPGLHRRIHELEHETKECICPELMTERAVMAAEMQRDAQKEGAW